MSRLHCLLVLLSVSLVAVFGQEGKKDDGKLPFSTGMIINVESAWLKKKCDIYSKPFPWRRSAMEEMEGGQMIDISEDAITGPDPTDVDKRGKKKKKKIAWPEGTVFCNVSLDDDSDDNTKPDCMGFWDCAVNWVKSISEHLTSLARPAHSSMPCDKHLKGFDMSGFTLLGTDFQTPDLRVGEPVQLKSQNAHKFCRVSEDDYYAVVCDQLTGGGTEGGGTGDGAEEHFELSYPDKDLAKAALADHTAAVAAIATKAAAVRTGVKTGGWGPPPGPDAKPVAMLIKSSLTDRYCSPRNKNTAPITCNTKAKDLDKHDVWLLSAPSYYPPYPGGPGGPRADGPAPTPAA